MTKSLSNRLYMLKGNWGNFIYIWKYCTFVILVWKHSYFVHALEVGPSRQPSVMDEIRHDEI